MRVAIVADIHGNLTAFEAVLRDLHETSPDLILHGGDLADAGSGPCEVVDRIRDLEWAGVIGNTDEMLAAPESLERFAAGSPQLESLWTVVREMAAATREALGEKRIAWLGGLPRVSLHESFALVHASPESAWRAPRADAPDAELASTYAPLQRPVVAYGHIHQPFVREIGELTVANTGSVSLSHDGDPRASYILIDGLRPAIRRVTYDIAVEGKRLTASRLPHAAWVARCLESARPSMP